MEVSFDFVPQTDEGLENATSYLSLEDANTIYLSRDHNDFWFTLTEEKRMQALNTATNIIDSRYYFAGAMVNEDQSLEFPRQQIYRRPTYKEYQPIPRQIKLATVLLAENVSRNNKFIDNQTLNISDVSVGPIKVGFTGAVNPIMPNYVYNIIKPFIIGFKSKGAAW